jgi:hypothetical protein
LGHSPDIKIAAVISFVATVGLGVLIAWTADSSSTRFLAWSVVLLLTTTLVLLRGLPVSRYCSGLLVSKDVAHERQFQQPPEKANSLQ